MERSKEVFQGNFIATMPTSEKKEDCKQLDVTTQDNRKGKKLQSMLAKGGKRNENRKK